jgi:dTDP-4-dehydrorhamnose reductase
MIARNSPDLSAGKWSASSVLVTGASGLLGAAVCAALRSRGCKVSAHARTARFRTEEAAPAFSLDETEKIDGLVESIRPDWIVHTAACVNLDACERSPAEATALHVTASCALAEAAQRWNSRLIYVSTDSVYDGDRSGKHAEEEAVRPINVYARTKFEGEQACLKVLSSTIVARVNFFGLDDNRERGLAAWILRELKAARSLTGFVDVLFSPLMNRDLAELLVETLERDAPGGVYNFGASDACSKYEFARSLARLINVSPDLVRPGALAESGLSTPRPLNTAMATEKLQHLLGRPLPTVQESLEHLLCGRAPRTLAA